MGKKKKKKNQYMTSCNWQNIKWYQKKNGTKDLYSLITQYNSND